MEAAEAKVQRILEGTKQFLVPHFQRPYSWREKQWETLWRDLIELTESPAGDAHFLGSIVSAPARSVPEGVDKRLLIDGQQRLTTVVLLLALLRNRATELGEARLADRINDLVVNRHYDDLDRYKLLPTQGDRREDSDREAFAALIDGRDHRTSSSIAAAAAYFRERLRRADAPPIYGLSIGRTGFTLALIAKFTRRCVEVRLLINSDDADEALRTLAEDRAAIEREIAVPLEWDFAPEQRRQSLRAHYDVDLQDRRQWPAATEWLARTAAAFKAALSPRITALDA